MPTRSPTIRPGTHIEMEVIPVEGIGVRTQCHREAPATRLMNGAEEIADLFRAAAPVGKYCDPPSVSQDEGRNVHRIGAPMLAETAARLPVHRPAAVASETL